MYYPLIPASSKLQNYCGGIKGLRPLNMALKNNCWESFEFMLKILMLDPCEINYMNYIKKNLINLLSYESDIAYEFLTKRCYRQLYSSKMTFDNKKNKYKQYLSKISTYMKRDYAN